MQGPASETLNTVKELSNSFEKAKNFLIRKRMVVITGVQGSGKTFLAKSLANVLQNDGKILESNWMCNLNHLHKEPSGKADIIIIDNIFFELQSYEKFKETFDALDQFLNSVGEAYLIITIPSYTWAIHCYEFDTKFYKVHVDLDKREEIEKLSILQSLKTQYDLSSEQLKKLCELQNDLLVTSLDYLGFPALVSWMCKQRSVEKIEKCLCNPLQTIRDDISSLKKSRIEDRGKFLVLSYMCLKDGKIDVQNVDNNIFCFLKKKYAPQFQDNDLAKYCEGMVGYYLSTDVDGWYEFDLNVMNKIVFNSLVEDTRYTKSVKVNCKDDYFQYITKENTSCPCDEDTLYTDFVSLV